MQKLCEMMSGYFDDSVNKKSVLKESSMPVSPYTCNWVVHTSPERFYREFSFNNHEQVIAFLSEIIRYQVSSNHSGTQKIEGNKVAIEVYTHDINRITELDQEYAKQVDFIYKDVLDFGI